MQLVWCHLTKEYRWTLPTTMNSNTANVYIVFSHWLAGPLLRCAEAVVERCHDDQNNLLTKELILQTVACEQDSFRVRHHCTMIEC